MLLFAPDNNAIISLQTEDQKEFIRDIERRKNMSGDLNFKWDDLCRSGIDQSLPEKIVFKWEGNGELQLSEHSDFSILLHTFKVEEGIAAENLKINTVYYWRVKSENEISEVRTFRTADEAPRFIHIDGNTNCRDIGGWKTTDGKTIRQGLIYRTSEFDRHVKITEEGFRAIKEDLQIKTDIDQRGEVRELITKSPLSSIGVSWHLCPCAPYNNLFDNEETKNSIAEIFRLFADENNYPLCFHCFGGADRGGSIAFLLEAFLGLSLEDCLTDYEATSLAVWSIRTRNYKPFADTIDALLHFTPESKNIKEGVTAYLLSIGVESSTLEKIKDNLLY